MSISSISYVKLLENLTKKEAFLKEKHNIVIPNDSWYHEAVTILKILITAIEKSEKLEKTDDNYWDRIFTALSLLSEMSEIFSVVQSLNEKNLTIFLSKLELTFKGPLLMSDEDSDTNLSRNTMFELTIFSRYFTKGIHAKLHIDNPDISFQVDVREYVIECKRIYKPETLVKNTHKALKQIVEKSFTKPLPKGVYARYGIVAVSLSRYIHNGDMLFDAKSQEVARERIYYEMNKIFEEHKEELLRPFTPNVPALLLEYSDRGSIDKPYKYSFIGVYETANGRYSNYKYVIQDFGKKLDN